MPHSSSIFYAVREIGFAGDTGRAPRKTQSAATAALLSEITATLDGTDICQSSKSHCRGKIAAALATGRGARIGIDVEYASPNRPIADIAAIYLGAAPEGLTASDFYRAWTFGEAWFKAFGTRPGPDLLRCVLERDDVEAQTYRLGDVGVVHESLGAGFFLSLVWRDLENTRPPQRVFSP